MIRMSARLLLVVACFAALTASTKASSLVPTGGYSLSPIYPSQIPGIGPVTVVTPGTTAGALVGNRVVTVSLPAGPASPPLFTLPATVGGSSAFAGGFAASDGAYILTGQTGAYLGPTFAGEAYLTPAGGGPTNSHTVNGIFDATARNSAFYVSAAHGPDDHGDSTGVYGSYFGNGIYSLDRSGGGITGLDLLFDTGAYSGALAADPFTGDIYFALGGLSNTLVGAPHDYNDLWVLKAADIAAAAGHGVISPAAADYVASIGTGFNDGINGLAFDPAGSLLVGLSDFTGTGLDRIVRYGVNRSNTADYLGTFAGTVAEGSDSSVKILDFALDGDTLRVTAIPEPGTLALLLAASIAFRRRISPKA